MRLFSAPPMDAVEKVPFKQRGREGGPVKEKPNTIVVLIRARKRRLYERGPNFLDNGGATAKRPGPAAATGIMNRGRVVILG